MDPQLWLTENCWQQKPFMFHPHDTSIFNYFNTDETIFKASVANGQIHDMAKTHIKGYFSGL
jgi:hypothetical protein